MCLTGCTRQRPSIYKGTTKKRGSFCGYITSKHFTKQFLTIASLAVMMAFLTTKFWFVESFWTFGMTFTAGQLPSFRALHTLIPSRSTACMTAQVTFRTGSSITVVSVKENCISLQSLPVYKSQPQFQFRITSLQCIYIDMFDNKLTHQHMSSCIHRSAIANP